MWVRRHTSPEQAKVNADPGFAPSSWASLLPSRSPVSLLPDSPASVCHLPGHQLAPSFLYLALGVCDSFFIPRLGPQRQDFVLGTDEASLSPFSQGSWRAEAMTLTTFQWKRVS